MVVFIGYFFWPTCIGNICSGILWNGTPDDNFGSLILLLMIFLIPFFSGLHGILKYFQGYGEGKFGRSPGLDKNATPERKRLLLTSSIAATLVSGSLVALLIWDLYLVSKM